mmetsp:Transcript_2880/g.10459  ORF Transcript_2880/g.10459 Transcript_2880/m.10459 type:complete len:210 (+) Transcript_2880:97-726(+)
MCRRRRYILFRHSFEVLAVAFCLELVRLCEHGLLHFGLVALHFGAEDWVRRREHAHREQARVGGVADGDGGDGYALGHLDDAQHRIEAVEVLERDGHANDGQGRERRYHPREVRSPARACDEHADAARRRRAGVLQHPIRRAVCRNHRHLTPNAEALQHLCGGAHAREVRVGAHDNADAHGEPRRALSAGLRCGCRDPAFRERLERLEP